VWPQQGPNRFPDLFHQYPKALVYLPSPPSTWRHTRQQFVADVDVLVTIGGAGGAYQAALELRLTGERLVPIGAFGGASSRLLAELLSSKMLREPEKVPSRFVLEFILTRSPARRGYPIMRRGQWFD
jgi:hypothetical protein